MYQFIEILSEEIGTQIPICIDPILSAMKIEAELSCEKYITSISLLPFKKRILSLLNSLLKENLLKERIEDTASISIMIFGCEKDNCIRYIYKLRLSCIAFWKSLLMQSNKIPDAMAQSFSKINELLIVMILKLESYDTKGDIIDFYKWVFQKVHADVDISIVRELLKQIQVIWMHFSTREASLVQQIFGSGGYKLLEPSDETEFVIFKCSIVRMLGSIVVVILLSEHTDYS